MIRPCLADQHAAVWGAIDALAGERVVSVSRLAIQAGIDPTTFNKSKRFMVRRGRAGADAPPALRWPSTETIARLLRATGRGWDDWARLVEARLPQVRIAA